MRYIVQCNINTINRNKREYDMKLYVIYLHQEKIYEKGKKYLKNYKLQILTGGTNN